MRAPAIAMDLESPRESRPASSVRLQHAVCAAILTLLPFLVHLPLWSPIGRHTIGMDYPDFQPGQQLLFLQSIRDGFFPLWAPGDAGGVPFAAYFIAQQYSPLTWIMGLLDATYNGGQLDLLTLQRLILLGVSAFFVYLLTRRLGLSALPGLVAGCLFVFNLRMLDNLRYGSALDAAVWVPVLVYLADRMAARPTLSLVPACALVQHLLVVSGHTQNAFYGICFADAWFLLRLWIARPAADGRERTGLMSPGPGVDCCGARGRSVGSPPRNGGCPLLPRHPRRRLSRIGCMAAAQVIGLGLSSALLIPMLREMVPLWTRRALGGTAYYYQVHMTGRDLLCNVLFPWLADIHSAFYASQYLTILLITAGIALLARRREAPFDDRRPFLFLIVAVAFCLLYSLGPLTPVAPIVNAIVPGITMFRAPARIMTVGTLAAAMTAAYVIQWLLVSPAAWNPFRRVAIGAACVYLAAGTTLLAAWMAGKAQWGEMVRYARELRLPLLGEINESAPVRIQNLDAMIPMMAGLIVAAAAVVLVAVVLTNRHRLSRTGLIVVMAVVGLVESAVYQSRGTYTTPGRYYTPHSDRFRSVDLYHARLFDKTSLFTYAKRSPIKYALPDGSLRMKFDLPGPLCEFLPQGGAPAWRIYFQNVRGHEIPRAYLTPHVRLVHGEALAAIRSLDPYDACVLDLNDPANSPAADDAAIAELARPADPGTDTRARFRQLNAEFAVEQYTPNRTVFRVTAPEPAFLNYNDIHSPDWQATVDGQPVRVYRVNHLFKGLPLQAGTHRVAFMYNPPSTWRGLAIALGASCLWLALTCTAVAARPSRRIAVGLVVLAVTLPAAARLHSHLHAMAYRDGLINFDPNAPRAHTPDRDEYLAAQATRPS